MAGPVLDGRARAERVNWVRGLDLAFELRLDGFSLLMVLLVTGIGALVHLYAARYFDVDRGGLHRLAGLLLLFTAAMLGVVTAANLLVLYVAWELTSVTSYLLIGWTDTDPRARASALQALLTTGAGGLAMLGGFVLIGQSAGTYELAVLAASPPTGTAVHVGIVLVLLGAFTKSALFPFSAWLPGAMVAPTPVSAFLHSATMVKAGVYLIARMAPVFAAVGFWRPLVLSVGLITMVTAGWRALRQHDLKRILAYGTVSQLGFMVVLFGSGTEVGALAGVTVLFAHALFKACLFLVVGVIDHQAHTRDIRVLGRYGSGWTGPKLVATVAGASMAGVPLMFGFVAKESAYEAFLHGEFDGSAAVLVGLVTGSVLTFAYTARLLLGAFTTWTPPSPSSRVEDDLDTFGRTDPPPAPAFVAWAPAAVLAAATVVLGLVPGLANSVVGASVVSLHPAVPDAHLAVWHGFNVALLLSVVTVSLGLVMALGSARVAAVGERLRTPVDGAAAYAASLRGLNRLAQRTVAIVQPGSLSIYIGVILLTATVVPGAVLIRSSWPADLATTSAPGDLVAAALLVVGAIGAAVARERIAAVLCMGAVGYGMALVFLLQGAPDLALTQMAVDTLLVVAFVLVLRRLPRRFAERPTRLGQVARLVVAALVGTFMFVVVLVAGGARVADPVSDAFLTLAPTEGGGRNVVNVVLVDIRGFDTMGEITVLVLASLGVYGLVRSGRRSDAQ